MSSFSFTVNSSFPRNIFSLNGMWELCGSTAENIPASFPHTVPVPALVDAAMPEYDWQAHNYHWYRTAFTLNERNARSIFLSIQQSMFGTDVWLNGHHLGGTISCYTSHEYKLNKFLHTEKPNELVIRVGAKHTLPPESAVGCDQEKEFFIPGIWGDVELQCVGNVRVHTVQVIPHCATASAEVRVTVENCSQQRCSVSVSANIVEKLSRKKVSPEKKQTVVCAEENQQQVVLHLPIHEMQCWSPQHPFLYEVELSVQSASIELDKTSARFGMREFKIIGSDFYLNGEKIFLRGSNIAFHRFLSDKQRKLLPWNEEWIKKVLIDIPKEHHFNFFRNHIGQLYNKWYDIADEYGMLIQNEWMFWCTTGSKEQIIKEFSEWLRDNWNHPSIIMWDPLNESTDDVVQYEVIPEMKKIDPTRPWESVDFKEEHPYIYSLGMVLNDRKFGFTRALSEIEMSGQPSMINEFLWWWINSDGKPTQLMDEVVERWVGKNYTTEDLLNHQAFLASELIELFRRMRVRAIQPFPYLSTSDGATAHWFSGDVAELKTTPIFDAFKNCLAPFGVSIELWDRHFFTNEQRAARIFIFNDTPKKKHGILRYGCCSSDGKFLSAQTIPVEANASDTTIVEATILFPSFSGSYLVTAELEEDGKIVATSKKIAHVFAPITVSEKFQHKNIVVLDASHEIQKYFSQEKIAYQEFSTERLATCSHFVVHGSVCAHATYQKNSKEISQYVAQGGTLLLLEPEYKIVGSAAVNIADDVELVITHRADIDKGGYDSYIFAEDQTHALWNGITKEHLKMFNGAYGGEVISQYDVVPNMPHTVLASCGLQLKVKAVFEIIYGKGKIIVSRVQVRGRLIDSPGSENLFARRVDPVIQQYVVNLLSL